MGAHFLNGPPPPKLEFVCPFCGRRCIVDAGGEILHQVPICSRYARLAGRPPPPAN